MKKLLRVILLVCLPMFGHVTIQAKETVAQNNNHEIIKNLVHALEHIYLSPEKAQNVAATLLAKSYSKQFNTTNDQEQFYSEIKLALIKATSDTGFDLYSDDSNITTKSEDGISGKITTEVSQDNIGYLAVHGSLDDKVGVPLLLDALQSMQGVKALIIDIREAEYTELPLVQLLTSYFVDTGIELGKLQTNDLIRPIDSLETEFKFNKSKPIYILNSAFVSGEWEFFSYTLQKQERATIIGETTMGMGQLLQSIKIADDLILTLPFAQFRSNDDSEGWHNVGVIPDVFAQGENVMRAAYQGVISEAK